MLLNRKNSADGKGTSGLLPTGAPRGWSDATGVGHINLARVVIADLKNPAELIVRPGRWPMGCGRQGSGLDAKSGGEMHHLTVFPANHHRLPAELAGQQMMRKTVIVLGEKVRIDGQLQTLRERR